MTTIFIGSSNESRKIATAIQENLGDDFTVVVWGHDIFSLGEGQFDSLIRASKDFDFAVFIADTDDLLLKRNIQGFAPRDNVILEIGLFIGSLGKERVYIVGPSNYAVMLPSDLAGINIGHYNVHDQKYLASALSPVSNRIRQQVEMHGPRDKNESSNIYVGSVCYKFDDEGLRFLLVPSSSGRWILPKGKLRPGDTPRLAAIRYAEDEGGVIGRSEILETGKYLHLKDDTGEEQTIITHIIRMVREVPPTEINRSPQWYSLDEAHKAVKLQRSAKYATELRNVLQWASECIGASNSTPRLLSGVIATRSSNGTTEMLLITSRRDRTWGIPKGEKREAEEPWAAAAREAREEAGISGYIKEVPLGEYDFMNTSTKQSVTIFHMTDVHEESNFDDIRIREKQWIPLSEAGRFIRVAKLNEIIKHLLNSR
jgi:8-oxo-dGTP pyrophosphatase MutT (NUDIX family)